MAASPCAIAVLRVRAGASCLKRESRVPLSQPLAHGPGKAHAVSLACGTVVLANNIGVIICREVFVADKETMFEILYGSHLCPNVFPTLTFSKVAVGHGEVAKVDVGRGPGFFSRRKGTSQPKYVWVSSSHTCMYGGCCPRLSWEAISGTSTGGN